ncbi:MAG TPA: FtsQ-type POTRA domain-containing protein [Candidatus Limiplasma sp.]|nr:FtsQ-type POTRA domain-containing protein [Candidatus Limiplasma sp.]HRX09694.1 FtsQ-type POTRA domain-containing protein [Candidatus Limiplasma sp.]
MRRDRGYPNEYGSQVYPPIPEEGQPYYGAPYGAAVYPSVKERNPNAIVYRLVVFLLVVSVALIVLQTVVFRLKTLYVIGNDTISAEHIASLSGLVRGDNIFTVSEDKVRESLKADHWIILSHMYKQYPGEVYLFIKERSIVATMQWLGIQYTLDIDGMVLEEYVDMDYPGKVPTVYGFGVSNATVGEFLSVRSKEQLIAYSSIVSELTIQRYQDQVVSINVSDPDQLSLLTRADITVQLGNSDYMRAKIGAMRTDIAYLQQLGEASGVLDVTTPEDGKFRRE